MQVPEEVHDLVRTAVRPTRTEILRAKKLILELMKDGETIGIGQLQRVLIDASLVKSSDIFRF